MDGRAAVAPRPRAADLLPPVLATTASVLPPFLTGALSVQLQDDLDFGAGGLGLAVAAFFTAGVLTSTPLGWAGERLGAGRSLRLGAMGSAGCLLAVALLAQDLTSLLLCLFAGGVANSITQPAANLYLARTIHPDRLGLAFGVKQSAIPIATLLGGVAVPTVGLTIGWQWAFAGGAVIAVIAAAITPPLAAAVRTDRGRRREGDVPLRPMIVLAAGVGLGAAAAGTLGTFLVDSATDAGVANGTAGLIAAFGSALGLSTRLTSGIRADRRGGGHLVVVWRMLAFGALTYLLLATGRPAMFFLAGPVAYASAWGWPALFHLAIVRRNPNAPAAATGITQTGTYVGAVGGPLVFGALAEHWGYDATWIGAAITSLAAAAAIAYGRRSLHAALAVR